MCMLISTTCSSCTVIFASPLHSPPPPLSLSLHPLSYRPSLPSAMTRLLPVSLLLSSTSVGGRSKAVLTQPLVSCRCLSQSTLCREAPGTNQSPSYASESSGHVSMHLREYGHSVRGRQDSCYLLVCRPCTK